MTIATVAEPILVDLDERTWSEHLDRAASWFGNVLTTQARFRKLVDDTVGDIHEPHIRDYLAQIVDVAREHERAAEELYRLIGRDPSAGRKLAGAGLAKADEATADLIGWAGGASGGWKGIRRMLLTNLDAIGAFGIAEQLGYALGLPAIAELTFPIVNEKTEQQLLLQEYLLETGPVSILYRDRV